MNSTSNLCCSWTEHKIEKYFGANNINETQISYVSSFFVHFIFTGIWWSRVKMVGSCAMYIFGYRLARSNVNISIYNVCLPSLTNTEYLMGVLGSYQSSGYMFTL